MEPLAHLSKATHGHVSVLPVAICLFAICTIANCRVTRWVLHALVVGVANGERVNQTNNQLIVDSTLLFDELNVSGGLWDEAKEGLCSNLLGACCGGGSRRKKNGGVTINDRWAAAGLQWMSAARIMDGRRWQARTIDGWRY